MNHIVNSHSGEELSLWDWLGAVRIRIPMMQRDYAQGRIGLHYLRERFLKSVFDTLRPHDKDDSLHLKLDFVYGEVKEPLDDSDLLLVTPIDGQQRLTTLWLIHWYVAMRSGAIKDTSVIERLRHFTYDTRLSSRKFCERLVKKGEEIRKLMARDRIGVVESIRRQTWYRNSWDCDPTVVGMLTTLSGDCHAPELCKDCIEKWCKEITDGIFPDIWRRLVLESSKCPITFYFQSLEGIGDADGLYVKMNARGKSLTAFENFKAELSDFAEAMTRQGQDTNVWSEVPRKLDTSWSDVFWVAPNNGGIEQVSADDRYLAFIRRLVFNDIVTQKNSSDEYQVGNDIKGFSLTVRDSTDFYHFFEGRCVYDSFNRYGEAFSRFIKIGSVLDFAAKVSAENVAQLIKESTPEWFKRSQSSWLDRFGFIPGNTDFVKDGSVLKDAITQPGRAWFLAIARFFERASDLDAIPRKQALKNWLRVVANIIENADINTMGSMIATMRLIDELSDHATNILKFLADSTKKIESGASVEQIKEEREKAEAIVSQKIEINCISEAEGELFNKGMIRYLYRKGGSPNWDGFETRRGNLQDLFRENGTAKKGTVPRFAANLKKDGLLNGSYRSISFILGNSQSAAAGWKRIFRDMHDKNCGGVCRQQLEDFIDLVDVSANEDVISLLVKALREMENEGSGLQTLVSRVLTEWTASVGRKAESQYDYVLTDYATRQQHPNNGLFVDLRGTEDEMKAEIARYGRLKGLMLPTDDVNDNQARHRNMDRYYFNGDRQHQLHKNELVRAIAIQYVKDNQGCTEEQFYEKFPKDLHSPYGIAARYDSKIVSKQGQGRWFIAKEHRLCMADEKELVVSNQWSASQEFKRVIDIALELGYTIEVVQNN